MATYRNRKQAGLTLAEALIQYRDKPDTLILALPRGGVPVAFEVAERLNAPLDVFLVRKLGTPGYAELAMGAIAQGGIVLVNQAVVRAYQVTDEELKAVTAKEQKELLRRELAYRGKRKPLELSGKTIILIDDGIATGATMSVAIQALKEKNPKEIIVAVPVADLEVVNKFKTMVNQFVCPMIVNNLHSVGAWYDDFSQTEDEEVRQLLATS